MTTSFEKYWSNSCSSAWVDVDSFSHSVLGRRNLEGKSHSPHITRSMRYPYHLTLLESDFSSGKLYFPPFSPKCKRQGFLLHLLDGAHPVFIKHNSEAMPAGKQVSTPDLTAPTKLSQRVASCIQPVPSWQAVSTKQHAGSALHQCRTQ